MKRFRSPRLDVTAMLLLLLSAGLVGASSSTDNDDYLERMSAEHAGDEPVASDATLGEPEVAIETMEVAYASMRRGKLSITGYLAQPEGHIEGAPGIIVIHEWWGLNDNIRSMAEQLAGQGYVALAVDLYQGGVATDRNEARKLAGEARGRDQESGENLYQAFNYLRKMHGVTRVGVIGWCFGGGYSLQAALQMGDRIDAAVIYYGQLVTDPARLAVLTAPVLGIFGAEDGGIPVETVHEFEAALAELDKPASIHVYEGAGHAFANPSGTRYQAEAAEDAWVKTLTFFREYLQPN